MHEPVTWLEDGRPHSPRFLDVYRSCGGGLAQARAVFMAGCGLPQAWQGREDYTVLETGFGLGTNFLATWAAWALDPARPQRLHFVSIEAYPVAAQDLQRSALALEAHTPEDAALQAQAMHLLPELVSAWAQVRPGLQTLSLHGGRVRLSLAVGEVQAMLADLNGLNVVADAVYLDGFSPSVNPEMWSAPVFAALAPCCRPGTTLGTYTTQPAVREALSQAGWQIERRRGLPPKRRRLLGVFRGLRSTGC